MTLTTISIITATIIYVAYNSVALAMFGVPQSLSMTYYLWKEKANAGWLFPLMMILIVAFMMPAWIGISEGSDFQFLAFLAPASIGFVGAAPAFLSSDLEKKVHTYSAYFAALCSLAWVCILTPYWWMIFIWLGFVAIMSILTSSYKTSYIYWLETVAFGATFTSTIVYSML